MKKVTKKEGIGSGRVFLFEISGWEYKIAKSIKK